MTSLQVLLDKNNEKRVYYNESEKEKKLIQTLSDLNEIQTNITDLLLQQDEKLDRLEDNVTMTEFRVKQALDDLVECDKMYFSYKPIIAGTILGSAICSPIITLVGVKYLGISTSVGGLLGGFAGYKIQK
uniref:t-SNARE coiled-coil homology domain-containing protein n=1 Tax=Mimiviridae sp. ChoanoV1 TaxID=2596887 RepID=A0A5B8IQ37_9VIRU|nr:hypothetical protein 3_53 [Mimiviridae sp. ChoanoV1]